MLDTRTVLPRLRYLFFAFLILGAGAAVGCGGDDGNGGSITSEASGRIQVSPASISFAQVPLGESETQKITLKNVSSESKLEILDIKLKARGDGSAEDLSLKNVPERPIELSKAEQTDGPTQKLDKAEFSIEFAPNDQRADQGVIEIVSTDSRFSRQEPLRVNVDTLSNSPSLRADPPVVRFARLPPGQKNSQKVRLRNIGSAPLKIYKKPVYSGGNSFSIEVPDREFPITLSVFDAEKAQQNPDQYELPITVNYAPTESGGETGEIRVESNDMSTEHPDNANHGLSVIDVKATSDGRCILVDKTTRQFGQVPVGSTQTEIVTVENCGSEPLTIKDISINKNSPDNEFALKPADFDPNGDGNVDADQTIASGSEKRFTLEYTPRQKGTDTGTVIVRNDDPVQPKLELKLIGHGSEGKCPQAKAVASVIEGSGVARPSITAAPLDYILLDGSSSSDPDGQIAKYEWEVLEKPSEVSVQFQSPPGGNTGDKKTKQQFRPLVAGLYKIGLKVVDNEGFQSCNQAVLSITAVPNEKIHVELTWTNPEDPDETDDNGSDVDVHLVKMGPGRWFESPYDVYFGNPNNGSNDTGQTGTTGIWNPESPSLDIDDTNGGGPENIQMDDPSNCTWYGVGVHYYRQLFGTAYVTLRVYINEQLVFEKLNKPLRKDGQFWDVARIHWGQGEATLFPVDEMLPGSPEGQKPKVTEAMKQSNLCTEAELY